MVQNIELKTKVVSSKLFSDIKYKFNGNITYQDYLWLTAFCSSCNLNEPDIIEIHHINRNRKDNSLHNLIGLCPNCHKRVHKNKISILVVNDVTFINNRTDTG